MKPRDRLQGSQFEQGSILWDHKLARVQPNFATTSLLIHSQKRCVTTGSYAASQ